ncbi:MAG TPA: hypothetical protein PKM63_01620 [Panacibacter sp.]|nr:hypothetical protein [Panacibacter sp.]HNP42953.1 hypothetical protein [Panacibacter sp.]
MIPFNEIKMGDYVTAAYEGSRRNGEVIEINRDDKQVCVETDVQEFWYEPEDLYPIAISDEEMLKLNFTKEVMNDGVVKYKKGAFRLVIPKENDFSSMEMWYREDRRDNPHALYIHQLQNHYHEMTKVHLTNAVMA